MEIIYFKFVLMVEMPWFYWFNTIFQANQDALKAFSHSGVEVIMGVGNDKLQAISYSQDSANDWVYDNIVPFNPATDIKNIISHSLYLGS